MISIFEQVCDTQLTNSFISSLTLIGTIEDDTCNKPCECCASAHPAVGHLCNDDPRCPIVEPPPEPTSTVSCANALGLCLIRDVLLCDFLISHVVCVFQLAGPHTLRRFPGHKQGLHHLFFQFEERQCRQRLGGKRFGQKRIGITMMSEHDDKG